MQLSKVPHPWQEITQGTSIGAQGLIRLPYFIRTDQMRLRILNSPVCLLISEFAIFAEPDATGSLIVSTSIEALPLDKQERHVLSAPGAKDKTVALLDNKASLWEGPFGKKPSDSTIIIDMGKQQEISGIIFMPPSEPLGKGIVDKYFPLHLLVPFFSRQCRVQQERYPNCVSYGKACLMIKYLSNCSFGIPYSRLTLM